MFHGYRLPQPYPVGMFCLNWKKSDKTNVFNKDRQLRIRLEKFYERKIPSQFYEASASMGGLNNVHGNLGSGASPFRIFT